MSRPTRPLGAVRRLLVGLFLLDLLAIATSLMNLLGGGDADLTIYPSGSGPVPVPPGLHASTLGVSVIEPTGWQNFLGLLSHNFIVALFALPMVIFARRLVDRATDSQPFTAEVVSGLRRLGILVLVGGGTAEVIRMVAEVLLHVSAVPDGNPFNFVPNGISLWWLLVGFTVIGFAQIVEHGRTLRLELDEVI